MKPKHRNILSQLPPEVRGSAQAYYDELERWEAEASEFKRARVKYANACKELQKKHAVVDPKPQNRPKGKLYVDIASGFYYEGTGHYWGQRRLKATGVDGARSTAYPRGPLVELAPDDPFREKRQVAKVCKKLEGES